MSTLFGDAQEKGPAFTATYDGEDSCCGQGIEAGELIQADGEGGWIHAYGECAEYVRTAPPIDKTKLCPRCFCDHRGEC